MEVRALRAEGVRMGYATFGPCPHCNALLSFLQGVAGSSMRPQCPRCHEVVAVTRATFLMRDNSRPSPAPKIPKTVA
jgi:hypothetical protein